MIPDFRDRKAGLLAYGSGHRSQVWLYPSPTGRRTRLVTRSVHGYDRTRGCKDLESMHIDSWFVEAGVEVPFGYQAEASK